MLIVSRDYGELGNAIQFASGLPKTMRPLVLLPRGMHPADVADDAIAFEYYASLDDIIRAVQNFGIDTVVLFSGYLITIGKHFSLINILRLIRFLRLRRITTLTSDPFIGLVQSADQLDFSIVCGQGPDNRRWKRIVIALSSRLLAFRIYALVRQLRPLWHVYPVPAVSPRPNGTCSLSYCHALAIDTSQNLARSMWLFVLSSIDCEIQLRRFGTRFVNALADRLKEARKIDRQVLVIATPQLITALRPLLGADNGVELRERHSYDDYIKSLNSAEYAFFWNYYSFSIIHRVNATRPVFFFDTGHMVTILPVIEQAGIELYYDNWRPPVLSVFDSVDEASLTQLADETTHEFQHINKRLRQGMSPLGLLEHARREKPG